MEEQHKRKIGGPADHLANERTFLAWIRTSIAIMAFGFVVVKFALFVKQIALIAGDKSASFVFPQHGHSGVLGLTLVIIGVLMSLFSFIRYKRVERQLLHHTYEPTSKTAMIFTLAIILVGVLLIYYLVPSI
jgi:putative membrane protein